MALPPDKRVDFRSIGSCDVNPDGPGGAEGKPGNANVCITVAGLNLKLGGSPPQEEVQYGDHPLPPKRINPSKESRKKFAPNAEQPTTASAPAGLKLPEQIKKVDPMAAAQVLQQMMMQLSMVQSMMSSTQTQTAKKTITNSFTGALAILAKQYGLEQVIQVMDKCLANDMIERLSDDYQDIVKDAIAGLIANASANGVENIKISERPPVVYGDLVPPKVITYNELPNFAVQNYYTKDSDPFPGYKVWQKENNYYFTKRGPEDYPYESLEEELKIEAEYDLANALSIYFEKMNLTVVILEPLLRKYLLITQSKGQEKSMGKNSSSPTSIMSILGILSSIISLAQSGHLPLSVLNQGSINQSLQKYTQAMTMVKQINAMTGSAFNLPSGLNALTNLGGITSIVGSINNIAGVLGNVTNITGSIPGLDAITSLAGNAATLTNLVGNIGNLGAFGNLGALQTNLGTLSSILNNASLASLSTIADQRNLNLNQITQLASMTNALQNANATVSLIQQSQQLVSRLL